MNRSKYTALYILFDLIAALLAWGCFFLYRTHIQEGKPYEQALSDPNLIKGLIIIPLTWVFAYLLYGQYRDVLRKSRLKELGQILFVSFFGTLAIFFVLILDD